MEGHFWKINQMKQPKNIALSVLVIATIVLAFSNMHSCTRTREFGKLYNASSGELQTSRNKLGQEKATNSILYGEVSDLKKINAGKDSTLSRLQELVNNRTISATVFSTATSSSVSSATVIGVFDTVFIDTCKTLIYPRYTTNFENDWERFNITATKDSFNIDYSVFNRYEFKQEWERYGFLKTKKRAVTGVLNLNPNTETKELQTFTVQCKCNKTKWFTAGAATGILAISLIKR